MEVDLFHVTKLAVPGVDVFHVTKLSVPELPSAQIVVGLNQNEIAAASNMREAV